MFILYFYNQHHEYHHSAGYRNWTGYNYYRPGEALWLVPGTDPDDCFYDLDLRDCEEQDEDDGGEIDETLEYMCELLEANEIEPDEFRRQLQSEGYDDETIRLAIRRICQ